MHPSDEEPPATEKKQTWVQNVIARVMALRAVRVFLSYSGKRGPLLAAGLSYQALFATFAAIWVGFSVAGLLIQQNPALQDALFSVLASSVPGLIDSGDGTGVINPETLLETGVLTWTGAIALVGLLGTALGWLASGRDAVRVMFGMGAATSNFLLLKLKDLGLALGFGAALLVSAALSVGSTAALEWVLGLVGIDSDEDVARYSVRILGLFIVFALDTVVLGTFYRLVSGIAIPIRRLIGGSLIGAAALGVLKALGSALLGGASSNPLLASFAVIIGLLIWFNFICQVILLGASWIAVGMADRGIAADPALEAERLETERQEKEELRQQVLTEFRPRWLGKLLGRRQQSEIDEETASGTDRSNEASERR